jgi:hypothetical protein
LPVDTSAQNLIYHPAWEKNNVIPQFGLLVRGCSQHGRTQLAQSCCIGQLSALEISYIKAIKRRPFLGRDPGMSNNHPQTGKAIENIV